MKRTFAAVLVVLLVSSCGGGGGNAPPAPPAPPPVASPSQQLAEELAGLELADFYDKSYEALSYRSPETIIWQGVTSVFPLDSVGLDDWSEDYRRETIAMYAVVLDALRTYDTSGLTNDEKLTFDFYGWYLADVVERLDFFYYDFVTAFNVFGVQSRTQRLFTDIHPLATRQDAEDYVTRLNAVLAKFRQVVDHLTSQSGAGIIEPRLTMDVSIGGLGAIADAQASNVPYYTALRDKIDDIAGLDAADRQALLDSALTATANSVIPAHRELRQALQGLRANAPAAIGVGQYPRGPEYYAYILRHHTTTDLTAAEIHELGLAELQRIHAEMRVIFDELGYPQNETLAQSFARVAADGGIIPAPDVRTTYEQIIAAAELELPAAFDVFPSADVVVADDRFGGFYIAPSFDGTRPGVFYAGTTFDQPWFQMPSLAYHESVPGHHTQIAIAMDAETLAFRKTLRFTAFSEGWALYAERLARELGWYDNDPYGNLGRLQYEALRAARLVVDTGIHSLGWSFETAVRFNQDNVGWSRGSSEGAAARYSVIPGQATAYMIGMLHILAARQRAIDELGDAFDLREFHRVVLLSGGIPLALLDGVVDRYIAGKLAAE